MTHDTARRAHGGPSIAHAHEVPGHGAAPAPGPTGYTGVADPGAAALLSFGMALLCVWVVEIITPQSRGVIAFGLLFAGLLQSISSILIFIRGDAYLGTLLAVFGTWLVAYHFFGMNERFGTTTARLAKEARRTPRLPSTSLNFVWSVV